MRQLKLPITSADEVRRWFPEEYRDGDQFALRLHGGTWIIAILANNRWYREGAQVVEPGTVSHWVRLNTGESK